MNIFEVKSLLPQIRDADLFVTFFFPPVSCSMSAFLMSWKFSFFVPICFLHVSIILLFPFSLILMSLLALLVSLLQSSQRSVVLDLSL